MSAEYVAPPRTVCLLHPEIPRLGNCAACILPSAGTTPCERCGGAGGHETPPMPDVAWRTCPWCEGSGFALVVKDGAR